ncbi:MAG: DNA recombination protein RmuC [Bacteroidales bacterium]|nr:DNA recombination protein RmuC [Bacteroidales bacterium]
MTLLYIALSIIGIVLIFIASNIYKANKGRDFEKNLMDLEKENTRLQTELNNREFALKEALKKGEELSFILKEKNEELEEKNIINSQLKAKYEALEEKQKDIKTEFEQLQKTSKMEFEKIANEILQEKTSIFTKTNKENIDEILKPFKESVKDFRENLDQKLKEQVIGRTSLEKTVENLMRQTNEVSKQANNLATALKSDNKAAGSWGEGILERILEYSGLKKDVHFSLQESFKDENGNIKRPDVIVHLPEGRDVIIDSKVSLVAYDRYFSAENEEEKNIALSQHLSSIRSHIDNLSSKQYQQMGKSLDFTMLFIPIEGAFSLAVQSSQDLWEYAYKKKIILVSTTTLIFSLKIIYDLWAKDTQSKEAYNIVKQGESLLNKFNTVLKNLESLGLHIKKANDDYEETIKLMKTGRGNLISQTEKLRDMGVKIPKELPKTFLDYEQEDSLNKE